MKRRLATLALLSISSFAAPGCGKSATPAPDATPAPAADTTPAPAADTTPAQAADTAPAQPAPPADGLVEQAPLDVAAPPANVEKTASGLAYKVLTPGKGGPKPTVDSTVTVHYSGWTTDGKMFDSSVVRGEPTSFPLKGVIPGWTEGVQLMELGSKVRFWIPEELAYKGAGGGAPQGMLVFDVELLSFK